MKDWVIRVEGLGKQYRIGAKRVRYSTLREGLTAALTGPFRRLTMSGKWSDKNDRVETIWALKDVSFEVKEGEVLGVIGRNGAGKSTLLKILSRITEPTAGSAEIRGRVGSLLEVGTGFHSELTGRENIYLNGAILGMKKAEIVRKFEEIVAFAEVEKFIDTPVKHYSSGMYLRLAFAVAAHLEPEILLVDEVLAVGDVAFQKRCLKKMGEVAKEGRTVLFVSHNMGAVSSICEHGLVIEEGTLMFAGPATKAVAFYLDQFNAVHQDKMPIGLRRDRTGTGEVKLVDFYVESETGEKLESVPNGRTARLVFPYVTRSDRPVQSVEFQIVVRTESGEPLFQFGTRFTGSKFKEVPRAGRFVFEMKRFPLVPGRYQLDTYVVVGANPSDFMLWSAQIHVVDGDYYGSGYRVFENESKFLVDGQVICQAILENGGNVENRSPCNAPVGD
jgi:lipopolysaccharide transport system ATP-binding protein